MSTVRKTIFPPLLVRIFAVIGFLVTLLIVIGVVTATFFSYSAPSEPDNVVLTIDFDRPVVEQSDSSPFAFASHEEPMALLDILHAIDNARTDPHVKGILAHFGGGQPSLAKVEEIVDALGRFRKAGKFAYAFGSSYGEFGNGNRSYMLASGFDKIWLQPVGAVSLTGVALELPFGKTALARYGISSDFFRREEYKSFEETFTRDNFSEPVRQNMQSMIDDMADQVADGVAAGRKWEVGHVKGLMLRGPFTASEALKLGLVNRIGYADELDKELDKQAGEDAERVDIDDYLAFGDSAKPEPKAHVALIYGTGEISDHGSTTADVTGSSVMGADTVAGAFNDAAGDKKIKAIIFRVDSPGGSPEASETIRAALMHAQKSGKPVFVSMGDLAASGGYWVSMSADHIVAQPGTITGSIGVLAGKFLIGGLMEKFGIGWERLATDPNAGMWSMAHAFTPMQRDRMNAFMDETYHDFVTGVSKARKIPMAKMPDIAKGRVFTGAQAVKIGLVDELGGYQETLAAVKKQLKLDPSDTVSLDQFPAPVTASERILKILKNVGAESAMVRTAFGQWQSVQMGLAPFLAALNGKPVQVHAPYAATHSQP